MKKLRIVNILILLLLLTGSCKKYVEGYEKDPNGLLETNIEQITQGILLEQQFALKDEGLRTAMIWLNQATGSQRQFLSFNNWNSVGNNQFDGPWGQLYTVISEARVMEDLADKAGNEKSRGLAKLLRAWAGGELAELWGDVPFSQAGLPDQFPDPKYDAQADVFAQVQSLLDEAIVDLNGAKIIYGDKDIFFSGDASKWIKVAHGLKARFYLAAGDYSNAKTEAAMGPSSTDDDMYAKFNSYVAPRGQWNPTFQFYWERDGYMSAENSYGVQITMNGGRDNAKTYEIIRAYYNYAPGSWWQSGYDYDLNVMIADWVGTNGKFGGPMELVTYGEMLLIQAEAEARTNGVAAALPIYNQYRTLLDNDNYLGHWGPVLSSNLTPPYGFYLPYDLTDFQAGGIENQDNVSELQAFLRELFEERYVFFIGDYQAFNDYARSFNDPDVPQYFQLKSGFNGQPLRFIYPQSEIDSNDNFPGEAPKVTVPLPMYQ